MNFDSHKKIDDILKEADLPKALSEDLKKELESHFYEKEHDLRFSGLKSNEIEKQLAEDFGNEELVAKHLNFVHKKSFYYFIKSLMQNENKPYIFETIFLFIIVFFLFQNTAWDMAAQIQIGRIDETVRTFTQGGFINLGIFLLLNFALTLRLFRGKAISQKLVASGLFIIMLGQIFFTYTLVTRNIIVANDFENSTDRELIENPEKYYEWTEGQFINHDNFKNGYRIAVPQSYVAYLRDGTLRFPIDLKGDEDIIAFGPPYGSDNELINISILNKTNSPDKSDEESWLNYYLKNELESKNIKYTQKEIPKDDGYMSVDLGITKMWYIELEENEKMRNDVLLVEKHNRLYEVLFNADNPVHHSIFFEMNAFDTFLPEAPIEWISFNHPACPYTIELPSDWMAYKDSEISTEGFFGEGFLEEFVEFKDLKDCDFKGFKSTDTRQNIETNYVKNQSLNDYLNSKDYFIIQEGETQWQGLPAKRILFGINNRGTGKYEEQVIDSGVRATAFAVQIKENEWLIFSYWYHPATPMYSPSPMSNFQERELIFGKIINSIKIK